MQRSRAGETPVIRLESRELDINMASIIAENRSHVDKTCYLNIYTDL
jgi:hypothetical protein